MPTYLFTQEDLEGRLSVEKVRQIYDDNNDGDADTNPIERLRLDAASKVVTKLLPSYPNAMSWTPTTAPNEAKRIALDYAEFYAAQRHPEYVRRANLEGFLKEINSDIADLRAANSRVDSTTELPRNSGGFSTTNESTITGTRYDGTGGMGDF